MLEILSDYHTDLAMVYTISLGLGPSYSQIGLLSTPTLLYQVFKFNYFTPGQGSKYQWQWAYQLAAKMIRFGCGSMYRIEVKKILDD